MKYDKDFLIVIIGEFIATAMLMYCIPMCGIDSPGFPGNRLQLSLGIGLAVGVILHIFIEVSGAHINPVVSVAYCITGHMSLELMAWYILVQFLGGFLGYALFMAVLPWDVVVANKGIAVIHDGYSQGHAFMIEYFATSALALFCLSAWDSRNAAHTEKNILKFALMIAILVLLADYHTGASLNPVHCLIPAVCHSLYKDVWVYVVSQIAAGASMALLWKYVFGRVGGSAAAPNRSED